MHSSEQIRTYFGDPYFIWIDPISAQKNDAASLASPTGRKRPLLVFLHGYGATEEDIALSYKGFPSRFATVAIRAPLPVGSGYMWFPLDLETNPDKVGYDAKNAHEATIGLLGWIRSIAGDYSSVTLLGFSMGMAMATNLLRYAPREFAAVIGLSGLVIGPNERTSPDNAGQAYADDEKEVPKVPFFWGRDPEDPIVTENRLGFTRQWLVRHTALEERMYPGIAHSISDQELRQVVEFLERYVPEQTADD